MFVTSLSYVHDNFKQVKIKMRAIHMDVCPLCLSVSSVLYSQQDKL